jgi:hypothetical protein
VAEARGKPLHFIGQIALADVKQLDLEKVLPTSGHLAFFAQLDHLRDDYAEVGSVVHVTGAAQRTKSPVASQLKAIGLLTPKPVLTLPYYEDPSITKLKLTDDERETYHDEVFLALLPDEAPHLLLGYGTAGTAYSAGSQTFLAQFAADERVGFARWKRRSSARVAASSARIEPYALHQSSARTSSTGRVLRTRSRERRARRASSTPNGSVSNPRGSCASGLMTNEAPIDDARRA